MVFSVILANDAEESCTHGCLSLLFVVSVIWSLVAMVAFLSPFVHTSHLTSALLVDDFPPYSDVGKRNKNCDEF